MPDTTISPSNLLWWGWLLCALILGVVTYVAVRFYNDCKFNYREYKISSVQELTSGALAVICGWSCLGCALIGIVRFMKWAWR